MFVKVGYDRVDHIPMIYMHLALAHKGNVTTVSTTRWTPPRSTRRCAATTVTGPSGSPSTSARRTAALVTAISMSAAVRRTRDRSAAPSRASAQDSRAWIRCWDHACGCTTCPGDLVVATASSRWRQRVAVRGTRQHHPLARGARIHCQRVEPALSEQLSRRRSRDLEWRA